MLLVMPWWTRCISTASKIPRFPLFTFFLATSADSCNSTASVSYCLRSSSRRRSLEGPAFPFVYKLAESCPATALVFYCVHSSSRHVDAVRRSLEGSVFSFVYIPPRDVWARFAVTWKVPWRRVLRTSLPRLPWISQASIPPWLHWYPLRKIFYIILA